MQHKKWGGILARTHEDTAGSKLLFLAKNSKKTQKHGKKDKNWKIRLCRIFCVILFLDYIFSLCMDIDDAPQEMEMK